MPILQGGKVIEGAGLGDPLLYPGAPSAGTDEVQTLTFGGTPNAGETFYLSFDGYETAAIAWSATNATLVANIDAALEALPSVGTGGVVTAVGTMTAGIGTITVTGAGNLGKKLLSTMARRLGTFTGTLAVAKTTPGVDATFRGAAVGAMLIDTVNALSYQNTGTALAPTWTKTGTES